MFESHKATVIKVIKVINSETKHFRDKSALGIINHNKRKKNFFRVPKIISCKFIDYDLPVLNILIRVLFPDS